MSSNGSTRGPPSYIRKPRQVRSRLAPIIISAVGLALMADRALAAEPQMPENFQNTWCLNGDLSNEPTLTAIPCSETQVVTSVRCVAAWLFLLATSATASPDHPNRSRKRGLVTDRAMEA